VPTSAFARGIVRLIDTDGEPAGLAAVARVTYDAVVVVATPPRNLDWKKLRVLVPGETEPERDPPRVLGSGTPLVLAFLRKGRDLRPYPVAPASPPIGEPSWLCVFEPASGPRGLLRAPAQIISTRALVSDSRDERFALATAPQLSEDDGRAPPDRARGAIGGIVLDRRFRLTGFVDMSDEERPLVATALPLQDQALKRILAAPGADMVRPDDGFLWFHARVVKPAGLPRIADRGITRDLLLDVRSGDRSGGTIELPSPDHPEVGQVTSGSIGLPAVGPVSFVLVGRAASFISGEVRDDLTTPQQLPSVAERVALRLELLPDVPDRFPSARDGPRLVQAQVQFSSVDPDARSGPSRSLAGAIAFPKPPIAEGRVDLRAQAATDFYAFPVDEPGPHVAILYRRTLGAQLQVRAFTPGFERELIAIDAGPEAPRLSHASGSLLRGRTILRVRQVAGDVGTAYELIVAPEGNPSDLVKLLFGLVGREAAREGAGFLDTDAFSDELGDLLLSFHFPQDKLARAVVDQLGHRVHVARRIALRLLDRHLAAPELATILEDALAQGGLPGCDAALVLARYKPDDARLKPLLRECTTDPDATIRARALGAAARSTDAAFIEELCRACQNDPSPLVQRVRASAAERARSLRAPPGG
jgi:hypothetical protein